MGIDSDAKEKSSESSSKKAKAKVFRGNQKS